jgi:hypothetical protein
VSSRHVRGSQGTCRARIKCGPECKVGQETSPTIQAKA